MLFNSLDFLLFLPTVLFIYFIIPNRVKHVWLLMASYYFYMCWKAKYALLILTSTVITYISGLLLEKVKNRAQDEGGRNRQKKIVVTISFS